ncbi:hypothetical protein ACIRU3_33330 [Streptomyces sp. NPDC101151]|uniref:hypothetical protein n=1 Tax=Streptomyces sp. NPDC101151 TaxID=3366115 RepID=UPI0038208AC3
MTRLSKFQRVALLAASTTVITGGLMLPGTAFAAPQTATVATDAHGADSAAQWAATTDHTSGVTAELPGQPEKETISENGVEGRTYTVPTEYGAMAFGVFDAPDGSAWDLAANLQSALDGYNSDSKSPDDVLTSSDVQEGTTADGQPALDAALSAPDGTIGHVRFIDAGDHMVEIVVLGTQDAQQDVDADYMQLLNGLQLPGGTTTQSY